MENGSNIVLTAVHCFERDELSEGIITAKAGKHRIHRNEPGEQTEKVVDFRLHENFEVINPTYIANDIAILKLEKPIRFTETIKPIDLPKYESSVEAGSHCLFAGWGRAPHLGGKIPDVLLELEVEENASVCNSDNYQEGIAGVTEGAPIYDNNAMMCIVRKTADSNATACDGDSGGPMVCKKDNNVIQEGIVSGPAFNPRCATPTTFVRVSAYTRWIQEQMKSLGVIRCQD
jgi:secreted trypsin-like serine protease